MLAIYRITRYLHASIWGMSVYFELFSIGTIVPRQPGPHGPGVFFHEGMLPAPARAHDSSCPSGVRRTWCLIALLTGRAVFGVLSAMSAAGVCLITGMTSEPGRARHARDGIRLKFASPEWLGRSHQKQGNRGTQVGTHGLETP